MTVKSWNNEFPDPRYTIQRATGNRVDHSPTTLGPRGSADGVRQRIKPSGFRSTGFSSNRREDVRGGPGQSCIGARPFLDYYGNGYYVWALKGPVRTDNVTADGLIAFTKAMSNMQENSFGEALGELRQSVNMITGRMGKMMQFAQNVKAGRWSSIGHDPSRKARRTPGSRRLADNWLEFNYGWKPLVSDIYDVVQLYHTGVQKRGTRVYRSSSHTVTGANGVSATAKAGFGGVVRNERIFGLNQMGLLNPLQLAWNLTTLSFVVDWFIPVSRTLGALSARSGLRVLDAWSTSHTNRTRVFTGNFCNQEQHILDSNESWLRVPRPGLVLPRFWINGSAFQVGRVVTATALLRQRS